MYKLVAIDMDGTLLRKDHTVSDHTKEVIRKVREKGVKVILATGRPLAGLHRYIEQLEMTDEEDYLICFNGALVQNIHTEKVVSTTVLKGSDLKEIYKVSQEMGVNIHAFSNQGCITPKMSEYTQVEADLNHIPIHIVDFNTVDDNEDIIKIMMVDEESILQCEA